MKICLFLVPAGTAMLALMPTPAAAEAIEGYVSGYPSYEAACKGARSNARTEATLIDHTVVEYSSCQCSQDRSGGWACEVVAYTRQRIRNVPRGTSSQPYPPRAVNPLPPMPDIYRSGNN